MVFCLLRGVPAPGVCVCVSVENDGYYRGWYASYWNAFLLVQAINVSFDKLA